jgi:hypothetical protein
VVPAVGDPDLSDDGQSLVQTIRRGDPDAIAGFRDAHIEKVRSYCARVCPPDRVDEACAAAFREFVARLRDGDGRVALDRVLLLATRSAAAGRFELDAPANAAICLAMPELVAAQANGELRADPATLRLHQQECPVCAATADRTNQAEDAFAHATGWLPHAGSSA